MIWDSSETARNIAECHKFSEGEHHILCGDNKILGCLFGKKVVDTNKQSYGRNVLF